MPPGWASAPRPARTGSSSTPAWTTAPAPGACSSPSWRQHRQSSRPFSSRAWYRRPAGLARCGSFAPAARCRCFRLRHWQPDMALPACFPAEQGRLLALCSPIAGPGNGRCKARHAGRRPRSWEALPERAASPRGARGRAGAHCGSFHWIYAEPRRRAQWEGCHNHAPDCEPGSRGGRLVGRTPEQGAAASPTAF